jgi:hypothetical protein
MSLGGFYSVLTTSILLTGLYALASCNLAKMLVLASGFGGGIGNYAPSCSSYILVQKSPCVVGGISPGFKPVFIGPYSG